MEGDIRRELDAYLNGDITLSTFRRWLSEQTWDNPAAPEVAHAIAYLIDEASSGSYSRSEVDAELVALIRSRATELV